MRRLMRRDPRRRGTLARPAPRRPFVGAFVLGGLASLAAVSGSTAQEAILYVTETQGDRVSAYRLGAGGRPAEEPFQRIDTGAESNPRRVAAHPDGCALYVATANRVEAFQIAANGRLSRFASDADTLGRMALLKPGNDQFLAVHPDGHSLYAALAARDQIHHYRLNPDGSLRRASTSPTDGSDPVEKDPPIASCVQGVTDVRYQGLAVTATHLYAAAHAPLQVEIFPLSADGSLQSVEERPPKNPDDDFVPETPQVFTECVRTRATFAPAFSRPFGYPKTLALNQPARDTLFATDRFRGRIYGCPIAPDGGLPDCPKKDKDDGNNLDRRLLKSKQSAVYEEMAVSEDGVLFATVFRAGRVRAFEQIPEEGKLKRKKKRTSDVFSTPVGLAPDGSILYVAQGELNRIDAFPVNATGFADTTPAWSTARRDGSFPNGVIVVRRSLDPAACTSPAATSTTLATTTTTTTTTTAPSTVTTTSVTSTTAPSTTTLTTSTTTTTL
jgi:6-phosphogluconolactonase (cycloisomerase 2 family)